MSSGQLRSQPTLRHTAGAAAVTRSMTTLRAAMPFVRAIVLVGLVVVLIMFGLPAVLAIGAAATP